MPLSKTLYGTVRNVPQKDERNWEALTNDLADMIDGVDGVSLLLSSGVTVTIQESVLTNVTAAMTLTVTHPVHKVIGDSATARALNGTTAIANGSVADQLLVLEGRDDTATVTLPDGANTDVNGEMVLGAGDSISLRWDATDSVWRELYRNN